MTLDRVAEAICASTAAGRMFPWSTLNERERDAWRAMATAAVEALQSQIKTVEELAALPAGSVVRYSDGSTDQRDVEGEWSWSWGAMEALLVDGPARVIWHPDWEAR